MDLRDIDFVGECSSEKGYYYGSEWHIDSLLEGVNFSIIFVNSKPINSVTSPITATQNFNVVNYFPFNRADFTFPSSDHPQQITIYDILGREVKRIEIPAGSTSYAMSSVGYPKGTYFARLGLQTASFMMN